MLFHYKKATWCAQSRYQSTQEIGLFVAKFLLPLFGLLAVLPKKVFTALLRVEECCFFFSPNLSKARGSLPWPGDGWADWARSLSAILQDDDEVKFEDLKVQVFQSPGATLNSLGQHSKSFPLKGWLFKVDIIKALFKGQFLLNQWLLPQWLFTIFYCDIILWHNLSENGER